MTRNATRKRVEGVEYGRFTDEVRRCVRAVDLAVIAAIPAVLLAVFALPEPVKIELVLAYTRPSVGTAFSSHFVHLSWDHLLSNLAGYALVCLPAYLFCVLAGRRRQFFVAFVTFVLAFPFAISGINALFVRPRIGFGFSGVVMAFLGFLPLALFWYLEDRIDAGFDLDHSPILFFLGMGLIATWAVPHTPRSMLVEGVVGLALLGYIRSLLRDVPSSVGGLLADAGTVGNLEFAISGLSLYFLFPFAAFPPDPTANGTILNLLSHLLGYSLGFIAPYVTFRLIDGGAARWRVLRPRPA